MASITFRATVLLIVRFFADSRKSLPTEIPSNRLTDLFLPTMLPSLSHSAARINFLLMPSTRSLSKPLFCANFLSLCRSIVFSVCGALAAFSILAAVIIA